MDFDDRAYLRNHERIERKTEAEVAKSILGIKDGAFEVLGGGIITLGYSDSQAPRANFVHVHPRHAKDIAKIDYFVNTSPAHEVRYAWDLTRPLAIGTIGSGRMSLPLARLNLRFIQSMDNLVEVSLWFDAIRLFETLTNLATMRDLVVTNNPVTSLEDLREFPAL